jgi:hypothetical protein
MPACLEYILVQKSFSSKVKKGKGCDQNFKEEERTAVPYPQEFHVGLLGSEECFVNFLVIINQVQSGGSSHT